MLRTCGVGLALFLDIRGEDLHHSFLWVSVISSQAKSGRMEAVEGGSSHESGEIQYHL